MRRAECEVTDIGEILGIVSRAKKVWKNHHRRLKEAAIETITPENGGSDGAQPSQGKAVAE